MHGHPPTVIWTFFKHLCTKASDLANIPGKIIRLYVIVNKNMYIDMH